MTPGPPAHRGRNQRWPAAPDGACAALRHRFTQWEIHYEPDAADGYPYRAYRAWPNGRDGRSGVLALTADTLADAMTFSEGSGLWP